MRKQTEPWSGHSSEVSVAGVISETGAESNGVVSADTHSHELCKEYLSGCWKGLEDTYLVVLSGPE